MTRDPRIDPNDGDELLQRHGTLRLLVDGVLDDVVLYRVVDSQDGLLGAWRVPLSRWREIAAEQCEGVRSLLLPAAEDGWRHGRHRCRRCAVSHESICSVCSRPTGFGDEERGEPPVNLARCPAPGGLECLAVAQAVAPLRRENEVLRSNSDHLSSENASLARQVESMAMRIESLAEELAKLGDVAKKLADLAVEIAAAAEPRGEETP